MHENIYIVGSPVLASQNDEAFSKKLNALKLPEGYAEYLNKFGEGTYCGIASVWPLEKIVTQHHERQDFLTGKNWWNSNILTLNIDRNCLPIGDSTEGDLLLFHPTTNMFFILNRGGLKVSQVQGNLSKGLDLFVKMISGHSFNTRFFLTKESEILSLQANSEEVTYDTLTEYIKSLKVHTKYEVHEFESYFFVPNILGLINVYDTGDELAVFVFGDERSNPSLIKEITQSLADLGFSDY